MPSLKTSSKHLQIDKATRTMMIIVGLSSVAIVFSLLSTKALLSQSSYQKRVLNERNKAAQQLKENLDAAKTLKTQYDVFVKANPNIIGGVGGTEANNSSGQDGDNAKIVLDALPSQYDFPALISSLEKIAKLDNLSLQGISGTDEGLGPDLSGNGTQSQSVPINFTLSARSDYGNLLKLLKDFERSIRPFDITNLSLSGSEGDINVNIQANTYYQPSSGLEISEKEVQ